jgi:hypothetical protein
MAKATFGSIRIPTPSKQQSNPKAYSYLRFSTPEQEEGDSIRRQLAVTKAYAKELKLELDESLRFEDKGVSAFRGRNSAEGELARFLECAQVGKVPAGSWLLVESLDRISRNEILLTGCLLPSLCRLACLAPWLPRSGAFLGCLARGCVCPDVLANPLPPFGHREILARLQKVGNDLARLGIASAREVVKEDPFQGRDNPAIEPVPRMAQLCNRLPELLGAEISRKGSSEDPVSLRV